MQRVLTILFYVVMAVVTIISLFFLLPASHKLNQMKARVAELETELAERNREAMEMRQFLSDLQSNPQAVEKVAREKFGFCREGEAIFVFQEPDENTPKLPPPPPGTN
jgi:cell division protein FtsB